MMIFYNCWRKYQQYMPSFSISSEWSQWLLCISLEKLKDMNIFLAPSVEKAQTKIGWLIESSQHFVMKSQCDLPRA